MINQTDVRLAIARRTDHGLILRGHFRTRGEVGPLLLTRTFDADGEPTGYDLLPADAAMLQPDQQDLFERLPEAFRFAEAERIYGKCPDHTSRTLRHMIALGLIRKVARGQYEKRGVRYRQEEQ